MSEPITLAYEQIDARDKIIAGEAFKRGMDIALPLMCRTLTTIQELATDTPTKRDMEIALNRIVRLCEDVLSTCESYP